MSFAMDKMVKGSVQKVNLVAALIRGEKVSEAVLQLQFCKKSVAKPILKVLYSAMSNSQNNEGLNIDDLFIDKVQVGKSVTLKRFRARAKGRMNRIEKLFSRISILLKEGKTV
jgi:large subunit ribosomal protein L22